ncbi:hypothetical protein A3D88_03635 [Candidatus Peribacteria bacterium RIFCSPHIGHO2_02_FULL_52_16]|nr:MAG: hypothetical protein A2706_04450 [Candidatus Peribacteria bacterium RIFCSPHIGHO2_01_FULL_51_35]OGJ61775.1 MAG: hypothetical protein A3D88_03635 [Candidatus Peribacteria bacterium RIFCSPHIGHO2_02_FULL_52_16]
MFPFLSHRGVLGLNARNLLYIKPFNPRKAVAFADDKLKTKAYLAARGIPVAKIYGKIESRKQLKSFDFSSLPDECVLKPNYGSGGEGILILKGRKDGRFLEQGKRPISEEALREHIEDILDGKFSVNGRTDTAFFEKILVSDPAFAPFRPSGLPDVRIVVFNLVPVMAMLRVPTAESRGKANVHLGGIGIGIDIAKGITTHATQYNRIVMEMPNGASPAGVEIPHWEELLLIASRIQQITNIGYLAVDLTIDVEQGPVLLEVNARAGLMLQVANLAPLRARLERVSGLRVSSPEKAVRISQDLFGEKVGKKKRDVAAAERPVLGTHEIITIAGDGVNVEVMSMVDPGQERTVFSPALIEELVPVGAAEMKDRMENTYLVKFSLQGKKIQTVVQEGETPEDFRAVIGRRDLMGFLIDPSKEKEESRSSVTVKEDARAVDRLLSQGDRMLMLLKYLKPVNLSEERVKLRAHHNYNPTFTYRELPEDVREMEQRLSAVSPEDSPLGVLQEKKRRELLMRISLLQSRGDAIRFTQASSALFGAPSAALQAHAAAFLATQAACDLPAAEGKIFSEEDAAPFFIEALETHGMHDWQVAVRPTVIADCTVGNKRVYLRAGATFTAARISALIAHEIETHALTQENGTHQPFELFRYGCANYLETQEGLAVFNQNRVLSPYHEKCYAPARNVLSVAFALSHTFADTRLFLEEFCGYRPERALTIALKLKRGLGDTAEPGCFTKDLVYFRGLQAVEHFVHAGGDLRRLYVGKIAIEDLALVEQVPGMKKPVVLPEYLQGEKKKD